MSTYTLSDQPLTIVRGRSGSFAMTWQDPSGAAIDLTGASLAAPLRWAGKKTDLAVPVIGVVDGRFKVVWTAEQVAQIPMGRLSVLNVSIVDTAGETHDYEIPVIGVVP